MTRPNDQDGVISVSALRRNRETRFALEPDAEARAEIADALGIVGLRKLRFAGDLVPQGKSGWRLSGDLGATVVQSCVVTLDPVSTRIDVAVLRRFVPEDEIDTPDPGSEMEMPEDDSLEPLTEVIDLRAVLTEALALALPPYPRKDGAALGEAVYADDGVTPLTDQSAKPFAGLAALKDKLADTDGDS